MCNQIPDTYFCWIVLDVVNFFVRISRSSVNEMEPEYLSREQVQYELRARNVIYETDASRRDLSSLLRKALKDESDGVRMHVPSLIRDPVAVEDEIFDLCGIVNDMHDVISQPGQDESLLKTLLIHARGRLGNLVFPSHLKSEEERLRQELDYVGNRAQAFKRKSVRSDKPSSDSGRSRGPMSDAPPQMADATDVELFVVEDDESDEVCAGAIPKVPMKPPGQASKGQSTPRKVVEERQHSVDLNLDFGSLAVAIRKTVLQERDKTPSTPNMSPPMPYTTPHKVMSRPKRSKSVGFVENDASSVRRKLNSGRLRDNPLRSSTASSDSDTDCRERSRRGRRQGRNSRRRFSSESDSSEPRAPRRHRTHSSHRNSPIRHWDLKFSGDPRKDDYSFKQFCKVVESLARTNGLSRTDLLESGIQLFEGKARKWFLNNMHRFDSWRELKERYKRDQLRDRDDEHLLDEAYDRKQGENEMCADFVESIQSVFESMDDPPGERQQVHIAQKNMLSEYRVQLVNSGRRFRTMDRLLEHCRDLDVVRRDVEREKAKSRSDPKRTFAQFRDSQNRVAKWKCWNCDSESHGFRACPQPIRKFCTNCGFKNVTSDQCPQCKPNFRRGPEGFRRQ